MKLSHILLTTDLSDLARLGYPHARSLAEAFGSRVTLFHVRERLYPSALPPDELHDYDTALGEAFSRRIVREKDACREMGLEVEVRSGLGTPSREILTYADERDVDFVILTSHGSRGRRNLLFGSTAKRVVRHIRVPLLLVPADSEAIHRGFRPYRRVVATTDFSEDSARGLDAALELCGVLGAELILAHIVQHPSPIPGVGGEPPAFVPTETLDWLRGQQEAELHRMVEEKGAETLRTWIGVGPDAPEGIVQAARDLDADLIVVPSHGKGALRAVLFGSTSEHVLNLSHVPVLVLPRTYLRGVGVDVEG